VLAGADHTDEWPILRQHLDTLAQQHVGIEASELPNRDQPIVAGVRHDERDLVDVSHDREQGAADGAGHPHPRGAEHVARDVAERARRLAPGVGGKSLLARWAGSGEQAFEGLGDRHARGLYPCRDSVPPS
jgi:hypothetical protein